MADGRQAIATREVAYRHTADKVLKVFLLALVCWIYASTSVARSNRPRAGQLTMQINAKALLYLYISWFLVMLGIALYGALFTSHGEYGVSAHLWLTLTCMPLSFGSWLLPHGSIIGVFVAGVLGVIEWLIVTKIFIR